MNCKITRRKGWHKSSDGPGELGPIPRNSGYSLSADLRLIDAAVLCGRVERLPHPPTPLASQRIEKEAAPQRPLWLFGPPRLTHPPSREYQILIQNYVCARANQRLPTGIVESVADRPLPRRLRSARLAQEAEGRKRSAKLANIAKLYSRAILIEMLIEHDAHLLPFEQIGKQRLPFLNRLTAQIPTIKLQANRTRTGLHWLAHRDGGLARTPQAHSRRNGARVSAKQAFLNSAGSN